MTNLNENFIEQLLIKANPDIDDEALDLLIEDVEPVLFDRVMTNLANKLDDKQLGEFTKIAKSEASEKEIYDYLSKCIPDYEKFIEKTYMEFEKMYLENYKGLQEDFKEKK